MEKINFKNKGQPGAIPANADNLNLMQNNVENSFKSNKTISDKDTYSCNYVNSIIESGSNSNGNWVKFNDGTMIEYGINYGVNDNYRLITFPIEFKTIEIVLSTINAYSEGYIYNSQIYDFNTKNCKAVVLYATINGAWNKGSNQFSWLAIGKWK